MRLFLAFLALMFVAAGTYMPSHQAYAADEEAAAPAPAKTDPAAGGAPATAEGGGAADQQKNDKDKVKDVSGGRFAGDPVYVHLAPMVMPVISDDGVEQLVTFQIDIEVKDFDVADHIHTIMPRVVDSLMRALYGGLGQGSLRHGKLVDVTKIKAKAYSAISEVVGADGIRDVLIQGVAQRML